MTAGYSGTPLPKKLGIVEGATVSVLGAPAGFVSGLRLPTSVDLGDRLRRSDIVVLFDRWTDSLEKSFHEAMEHIPPNGAIWVAWPKRSSRVETDITEDTLRDLFLPTGMVDNKVIAIDETWSGLRFVVRKENRRAWPDR